MNARSVGNKLDYVFDHIIDNNLDIVALTETWLSNKEVNNRRVVMECSTHGYMLHHVPRKSGRTGGGVGVLINDRVKLITRLDLLCLSKVLETTMCNCLINFTDRRDI